MLVPTAMRNGPVTQMEHAIERHLLGTGLMDVSSPATFWAWLHGRWLPQLHQHRTSFPPSGALVYDRRQRPVIAAYGNAYIARPRPLEDPSGANPNAAFWGVGMVLRQHRVGMTNCSSVFAGVSRFAPADALDGDAERAAGAGKCHEKKLLATGDSWELTQYTTTTRSKFTMRECAQGCNQFGAQGCTAWIVMDGDGFSTARYTDAGISGAKVPADQPRLPASKQLEAPSAARRSACFLAGASQTPFSCADRVVATEDEVPPRGEACVNGVKMTAFRPASCPAAAHLCAAPFSHATKDVKASHWDGREGFGFRAGNGGWQRRWSGGSEAGSEAGSGGVGDAAALEALEEHAWGDRRALTDWSKMVSSNSSLGANSSKAGAGGLDVTRYGDPWRYTEGQERLWGGPWSGGGPAAGRLAAFPGGGYGVDLLQEGGVARITSDLEKSGWIDRATRAVSLDMWVLLPQSGHVTKVTILLELALGGRWIPSVSLRSGPLMRAAMEAAAAADEFVASRPKDGVGGGKVARGVGAWVGMEVLIIVLQSLVLLAAFVWASAYALMFHPRALVPRLVLLIVRHVASFAAFLLAAMRGCWAACWHAGGNLARQSVEASKAAMEENHGIKKVSPPRQVQRGWLRGHMEGGKEEGDEQRMLSVMVAPPDQRDPKAHAEGGILRKHARLEEEVHVQDVVAGDGGGSVRQSLSRAQQVVSPSEVPMQEVGLQAEHQQEHQPPLGPGVASGTAAGVEGAVEGAVEGVVEGAGRHHAPALAVDTHLGATAAKPALSRAATDGARSVAWSHADDGDLVPHHADDGERELVRTSLTRQALAGGWLGGELWPMWDATCLLLLFSRLMLELLRVFGGPRAGGGRGPGSDKETGWWVGGADFDQLLQDSRSSDVLGAAAFVLLLLGGVRFWRSSRVLVMLLRLCSKAAPAVGGLLGLVLVLLSANASRRVLLHVHSPACQPTWGEMLANSLDQLLPFDGAAVATEATAAAAPHVAGQARGRVTGTQFWRRARPPGPFAPLPPPPFLLLYRSACMYGYARGCRQQRQCARGGSRGSVRAAAGRPVCRWR